LKTPVKPITVGKPTYLSHTSYGKVVQGMDTIHRKEKPKVAHINATRIRDINNAKLESPLKNHVSHMKRGNYEEIQAILNKSLADNHKPQPDYHLQMKALEAKGYINMGLNADNQRENYLRERLLGAGASDEEIEKVLKEARLEKFKKAIRTPQSLDQRLQQVMASIKPSQTINNNNTTNNNTTNHNTTNHNSTNHIHNHPPSDTTPTSFPQPSPLATSFPKPSPLATMTRRRSLPDVISASKWKYSKARRGDVAVEEGLARGAKEVISPFAPATQLKRTPSKPERRNMADFVAGAGVPSTDIKPRNIFGWGGARPGAGRPKNG
jgi:hypothetical protein